MYRQQIFQKASPAVRTTPKNQDITPNQSYGSLSSVVQRVQQDPHSVNEDERQQLESAIGSRSTREILAGKQTQWVPNFQGISTQLWGNSGQVGTPIQAKGSEVQPENQTGLPDHLKAGIENLSGIAMDDVRVHYNSSKPAELQALAYTQGTDIHIAPGQEQHLPHEAWHVVQQMQGRVKPTIQAKGVGINDDQGLEREADVMSSRAIHLHQNVEQPILSQASIPIVQYKKIGVVQRMTQLEADNLDSYNYPSNNIAFVKYKQTADGNSLWIFRWNHFKNPVNNIEIHVHRGEVADVSGINVRWLGEVGQGVSVDPAPLWIQAAAQNAVIAYMMNLSTGKGIFSNIKGI